MSTIDSIFQQYEKNTASSNSNKMSQDDRQKKYFTTVLDGKRSGEKRIRILPSSDGSSPFVEVYFHEIQVDGKWMKLYDPAQENLPSPLNEVRDELLKTGLQEDKELARSYRSKKFYIVKVIDRDNEQDGVKFWRFKHNTKNEGVLDKIFPIFKKKGDITDIETGRDLTLNLVLTKSGTGKEYTTINSIMYEDPAPLSEDKEQVEAWLKENNSIVWGDVYAKRDVSYLELVASGKTPKWDDVAKKFVSSDNTSEEVTVGGSKNEPVEDPQTNEAPADDLPF